jgi:hypothetical protein
LSKKAGRFLKKRLGSLNPAGFCGANRNVEAAPAEPLICTHEEWSPLASSKEPKSVPKTKLVEYVVAVPGMPTKVGTYSTEIEEEELIPSYIAY